jgi:probable HAF family extracellular repeat protein
MWQDEHVIELADGGGSGWAVDINKHGEIIGHWYADPAPPHIGMFIWRDGEMRSLGSFTGYLEYASAINNHGQVVGVADVNATASLRGFIWERGVLTDLNTLLRPGSRWLIVEAYDINDSGQIVGVGHRDGLRHRAVLLTPVAYEADPSADESADLDDLGIWIGDTDKSVP